MDSICRFPMALLLVLCLAKTESAIADVVNLTLNPTAVYGADPSQGTVTLDASFPRVRTVSLVSTNPNVASVPQTVTVGFGRDTATFTVSTSPVATPTDVTIIATHDGVSRQAVLTVRPPILTSISFNPDPICGGMTTVATIHINRPAPSNWLCSIQGPYPPVYFMTGSIVAFTPGTTVTTKQVNTTQVTQSIAALITVRPPTGQSPNITGYLAIEPVQVDSVTLTPSGVEGGDGALACVRLNCAAPAGGATIALSSSDPLIAAVPSTLHIDAGDMENCFLVQTESVAACTAVQIMASYGGAVVEATLSIGSSRQLTNNAANDRWSGRHSSTVGGNVLWTDGNDVFHNGGAGTQTIQALGALESVEDFVFGLGAGAAPSGVIGAWRRGTDFAWVWRSGNAPVLVTATNPIDADQPLNPEALAIADGHVFMVLQAFAGGSAVKHVFRVDPVTGVATNLTGSAAVPGAARVVTSGGKAAWVFDDDTGVPKLHWYDGAAVSVIDSGEISGLRLARGRLVYTRAEGGIRHVYLYDSTTGAPPVRLSNETDAAHGNFAPTTDGYHVAWLYGDADGTNLDVLLAGVVQLNDAASRPRPLAVNDEFPVQLNRGQAIWRGAADALFAVASGQIETVCTTPAAAFNRPFLADGYVAGFGPVQGASETDNEIVLQTLAPPGDQDTPLPPLKVVATAGSREVELRWDAILGATSYNIYLAETPGVTRTNYASLPGGRRIGGVAGTAEVVAGLVNGRPYYFVVTSVESVDEGGESAEVSATPQEPWIAVGDLSTVAFFAVAAHPTDGAIVYAAGNDSVYKTTDGGFTWTPLGGAIAGRDVRAIAVEGDTVFALDIDGDDVLRSSNAGQNWAVVADGFDFGEVNGSIAIDPADPQVIYAGDLRLAPDSPTLVIRSIDGGDTWEHLPPTGIGELHAYALAIGPSGVVYLGGSGVPIARSDNGGDSWTDVSGGIASSIYSLAIDPSTPDTLFAGTLTLGIYRSTDAGATWTVSNDGLPLEGYEPVTSIVIDPVSAAHVEIGTARGPFSSIDGGATWVEHTQGMGPQWTYAMARTAAGRLIAATSAGLYLLDTSCLGDLDGDSVVGLQDLATLLSHFGQSDGATGSDGDTNGDGDVDLSDLAVLLGRYGTVCP